MSSLNRTPATAELGLRPFHLGKVDVPLYAFETAFAKGRVLSGAKRFARASKVPRTTLVDRSTTYEHDDPIFAVPERNDFLKTVVPFLDRIR